MTTSERRRLNHFAVSLAVLCVSVACGGGSGSAGVSNPSPESTPGWLTSDVGNKSVKLTLISSYNSDNAGFNFDGYSNGKMVVSVPDGWHVTVDCQNHGNGNHSCAIVKKAGDQVPAFAGSASPDAVHGFPNGLNQTFTFQAANPGTYRISCLVPGHDDSGMWDTFVVTAGGAPSITFK